MAEQHATAIFGGSFDPVHNGHLSLVQALCDAGHAAEIILVPAAQPPHKRGRQLAPARHRLAMLQLAVAEDSRLRVSDCELQRDGISYTVVTAAHFAQQLGAPPALVIGADTLLDLHNWYEAATLVAHYPFIVYRRSGYPLPAVEALAVHHGAAAAQRLLASVVACTVVPGSSTEVRATMRAGEPATGMVPPAVSAYIAEHRLYSDS
jgi:nicotinate-nucleotide adenylyltransferase